MSSKGRFTVPSAARDLVERLEAVKASLPEGIEILPTYDRSALIWDTLTNFFQAIVYELIVVILVIDQFRAGTLCRSQWTHEAHLAATTYLLTRRPDVRAKGAGRPAPPGSRAAQFGCAFRLRRFRCSRGFHRFEFDALDLRGFDARRDIVARCIRRAAARSCR